MHGLVVDVGTDTLSDVEAIALSLWCLTEVLLFVGDVMLRARNDSSVLNASNRWIDQGASQVWIWTETFLRELLDHGPETTRCATHPVPPPFWRTS
jgi:hypothetical protein